jgi:hypothetical protein
VHHCRRYVRRNEDRFVRAVDPLRPFDFLVQSLFEDLHAGRSSFGSQQPQHLLRGSVAQRAVRVRFL